MLQEKLNDYLEKLRKDQISWKDLEWKVDNQKEEYEDINELNRKKALIALQLDLQTDDKELIKFILTEETKNYANHPLQGGSEILNEIAFLLATFKEPGHVWLMTRAKTANFDTHCGFDIENILSAGIDETFNFIKQNQHESKALFENYFENRNDCTYTKEDIEQWFESKRKWHFKLEEEQDNEYWLNIALEINEKSFAKILLLQIEEEAVINRDSIQNLKYYYNQLGDNAQVIKYTKLLLEYPAKDNPDISIFDYYDLIRVYLFDNQYNKAWEALSRLIQTFSDIDENFVGMVNETALDLVIATAGEAKFSADAYQFSIRKLGRFLSLNVLKKYLRAARLMQDIRGEEVFFELYNKEKKRFDDMLKQ